jgi:hypothetical protein
MDFFPMDWRGTTRGALNVAAAFAATPDNFLGALLVAITDGGNALFSPRVPGGVRISAAVADRGASFSNFGAMRVKPGLGSALGVFAAGRTKTSF